MLWKCKARVALMGISDCFREEVVEALLYDGTLIPTVEHLETLNIKSEG